eukprot:TRINITY_DN33814_c0_g1_i1.p1 TRINITY_DN33814_c0_g1~~TRINITY_DN33814_c0_g1_i1.p1  ORF type:complete len:620 (+),score=110.56 TRINITY_DN33814_c0_g1_i1:164-2023(+)
MEAPSREGSGSLHRLLDMFHICDPRREGLIERDLLAMALHKSICVMSMEEIWMLLESAELTEFSGDKVSYKEFLGWLTQGLFAEEPDPRPLTAPPIALSIPEECSHEDIEVDTTPWPPSCDVVMSKTAAWSPRRQCSLQSVPSSGLRIPTKPATPGVSLEQVCESLVGIARKISSVFPEQATALCGHARELRSTLTANSRCPSRQGSRMPSRQVSQFHVESLRFPGGHDDDSPAHHLMGADMAQRMRVAQVSYREQAAIVVERTGSAGEALDDVQEIPIADIKDKLALSYWRFCGDLRVYKSATVTEALRLICSAPVPGLGGTTTYMDVFRTLTKSPVWANHIYLFGGLVRDILRRTVGNDIDIGFSAPAAELEEICNSAGYTCRLDGDYILIGDEYGEEYLEGMVISFNGIQPPEHADFSMNTLFYDFTNDIIIDKTGLGVPAVLDNRCVLPCSRDRWQSWIDINGVRVCFRFFKFLLRGYGYLEHEMLYVTEVMLDCWTRDEETTMEIGRIALGNLVGCTDDAKLARLRELVLLGYNMVLHPRRLLPAAAGSARRKRERQTSMIVKGNADVASLISNAVLGVDSDAKLNRFLSASSWWLQGWRKLLKIAPLEASTAI